jgi:hypothetical protein
MGNKVSLIDGIPTPEKYLQIRKNVEMSKLENEARHLETKKNYLLLAVQAAMIRGENRLAMSCYYGTTSAIADIDRMIVAILEQKGYTCEFQNDRGYKYLVWTVKSMEKTDGEEQTNQEDLPPYDTNW